MRNRLSIQLAARLAVPPESIWRFVPDGQGTYMVLLHDFRKFRRVMPLLEAEDDAGESAGEGEDEGYVERRAVETPHGLVYLDPGQWRVWQQPGRHTRAELRQVAALLGVPRAARLNKRPLIQAIESSRTGAGQYAG